MGVRLRAWALALIAVLAVGTWSLHQSVYLLGIDDQVDAASEGLSSGEHARLRSAYQGFYRTDYGLPYMYDYDSYYYLERAARGDHGGSVFIFLEWLSYAAQQGLAPSDATFFLPMVFGLLALVTFFFLAKKVTGSTEASFFSSLILALQHRFYGATAAGMGDVQSISILFSVVFFLLAVLAFEAWNAKDYRRAGLFSALSVFVFVLFFLTWQGAVYVLAVAAAAGILSKGVQLWRSRSWARLGVLAALSVVAAAAFSITPVGLRAVRYLQPGQYGAVARNIAELYGHDPVIFAAALGGWAVLGAAVIGALFLIGKEKRADFRSLLVVAWFALLAFATYQAVRFMYYALPPVSLLAGFAVHKAVSSVRQSTGKEWTRFAAFCLAVIVIFAAMLPYLLQSHRTMLPRMNDAVISVGVSIDRQMPADAPVISWWDYGHFWRYASKREPYLQGRQRGAETDLSRVWLAARSFLSSNVSEAKNIWTILMCKERDWVVSRIGSQGLLSNPHHCAAPKEAAVIVDEDMIASAQYMLDVVVAQDASFAAGPVWASPVRQCVQEGNLLSCGDLRVDISTLSAAEGKQVHLYRNGTRTASATSGDAVVAYEAGGSYSAFATSGWLADTMLVRLFAGERFEMEQVALAEDPVRVAAYRFSQG